MGTLQAFHSVSMTVGFKSSNQCTTLSFFLFFSRDDRLKRSTFFLGIAEWRLRSWQQLKRSMLCRKLCSELCSFVARWTEARYVVGNSNATWKYAALCLCVAAYLSVFQM